VILQVRNDLNYKTAEGKPRPCHLLQNVVQSLLVAEDVPDQVIAVAASAGKATAIAPMVFDEFADVLFACQLGWRLPPPELLKELNSLEDSRRPFSN
jgi:hypothetical protein